MARVPLIKGDSISVETDYRDALPVNMYAVEREILGGIGYMLCYPGLTKFAAGVNIDRGGNYNDRFSRQYRVSGTKLIQVNEDGSITELGDIVGTRQAAMPYSFNTQCIIANGRMFLYDPAGGFRQVVDTDLGNPLDGVWVDGYYFLTDGEYVYHTDIDDEESVHPLKFATAEFMPDPSIGVAKTQDNKVMVFGRYTVEYFEDQATENFAFQRVVPRAQKIGIVATHAKCESGNKWYITGGRKEEALGVHILAAGASEKVSTREVDKILSGYIEPELSDMRMESRMEDNVVFVLVHLPNETLCFNETIAKKLGLQNAWAILTSGTVGGNYRAINGVFDARLGFWVFGDKQNGNISKLDNTVFTEFGEPNEWLLYTPFLNLETASIDEVELETIPGHTVDSDATVAISLTYDGLTYGMEWFQMYGLPLDYAQRFIVRRLGYVSDWVGFKFRGATRSRMSFAVMDIKYG